MELGMGSSSSTLPSNAAITTGHSNINAQPKHNDATATGKPRKIPKPKRPLTAYNIFFQQERERLLGLDQDAAEEETVGDGKKRKHNGNPKERLKLGLVTYISKKWKLLDEEARTKFVDQATKDMIRYRQEMKEYKASREAIAKAGGAKKTERKPPLTEFRNGKKSSIKPEDVKVPARAVSVGTAGTALVLPASSHADAHSVVAPSLSTSGSTVGKKPLVKSSNFEEIVRQTKEVGEQTREDVEVGDSSFKECKNGMNRFLVGPDGGVPIFVGVGEEKKEDDSDILRQQLQSTTPAFPFTTPNIPAMESVLNAPPVVGKQGENLNSSTTAQELAVNMPKRPRTAYNFFFSTQRAKLLGLEQSNCDDDVVGPSSKRKHRKTHGKIGFTELAKYIGDEWKQLDSKQRSLYVDQAAKDLERYQNEMKLYWEKVRTSNTPIDRTASIYTSMSGMEDASVLEVLSSEGDQEVKVDQEVKKPRFKPRDLSMTTVVCGRASNRYVKNVSMSSVTEAVNMARRNARIDAIREAAREKSAEENTVAPEDSLKEVKEDNAAKVEQHQQQRISSPLLDGHKEVLEKALDTCTNFPSQSYTRSKSITGIQLGEILRNEEIENLLRCDDFTSQKNYSIADMGEQLDEILNCDIDSWSASGSSTSAGNRRTVCHIEKQLDEVLRNDDVDNLLTMPDVLDVYVDKVEKEGSLPRIHMNEFEGSKRENEIVNAMSKIPPCKPSDLLLKSPMNHHKLGGHLPSLTSLLPPNHSKQMTLTKALQTCQAPSTPLPSNCTSVDIEYQLNKMLKDEDVDMLLTLPDILEF